MEDPNGQTALAGIGHNLPPDPAAELIAGLRERNLRAFDRAAELLEAAARVPATLDSDELASKASAFTVQIREASKALDEARKTEKEPYLKVGKTIDVTFGEVIKRLDDLQQAVRRRLDAYLQAKARAEREAREAERKAAEAEAQRQTELARAAREAAERQSSVVADIQAKQAAVAAQEAAVQAEALTQRAEAPVADLSRTKGSGATATLATVWGFRDLDMAAVDLNALRPYLAVADVEKAVRAFIRAGGRELAGVIIEQQHTARVR